MQISRRSALMGATAAVAVVGVPMAAQAREILPAVMDAKTREVLELFPQLNPVRRDLVLWTMREFLKIQRANESHGFTAADDAAGYQGRAGQ